MKEIGKILREKRTQMNISIADVHKITKIQEKYLIAMEEGDMRYVFSEVYYKSFVRSYASYLGFDPEKLIKLLKNNSGELKKDIAENAKNIKKLLIIFATVIVIVFLLIGLYLVHMHTSNISHFSSMKVEKKIQNFNGLTKCCANESKQIRVYNNTNQKLVVEATNSVWLRVDCDNKRVYENILSQGTKKSWEAEKSFALKIGYVPGIKVFFNGEQIDVLSGSVKNVNTIVLNKKQ
jgi:cytoskeletal protein RodZ